MSRQLLFPFVLFFVVTLGVATVLSWSFLPDNGRDVPLTLAIVGVCVAVAAVAAAFIETRSRAGDR